jgi:hypothetical protein
LHGTMPTIIPYETIVEIRTSYSQSRPSVLSAKFGISDAHIRRILKGTTRRTG